MAKGLDTKITKSSKNKLPTRQSIPIYCALIGRGPITLDLRDIFKLCDIVRETAFASHCFLRHGYGENIYENSLVHRLRKQGLNVVSQPEVSVRDEDGTLLGKFKPDAIVEGVLVLELKACKGLVDEHIGQVLGYLRATGLEHGLLINFGAQKLQVKKIVL